MVKCLKGKVRGFFIPFPIYPFHRFPLLFFVLLLFSCAHSNSTQKESRANMTNEGGVPIIYAALGDSTGVGVGARQGGGYVARVFERIKRERPQSRLNNFCVSGATTEDVLRGQLQPAINSHPTLVTIGIGINDIGHGFTFEAFARNYEEIVKRVKEETPARIVVTNLPDISLAPVVSTSLHDQTRRRVEIFNDKIKEIAGRYGAQLVDIYSATQQMIPTHPEFFSDDGFHPSDAGYEYWAKTMWPTVKDAINQ
jgi:acyl-CoA thioesterase-1